MFDIDEFVLNLFADSVFTDLNVTNAFCAHVVRPLHTRCVVIVNDNGSVCVVFEDAEILEDVGNLLKGLCAFVNGADFGFARTASGIRLALGAPGEGATEPDDIACYRAGFE